MIAITIGARRSWMKDSVGRCGSSLSLLVSYSDLVPFERKARKCSPEQQSRNRAKLLMAVT